jgi:putative flippase GtrA
MIFVLRPTLEKTAILRASSTTALSERSIYRSSCLRMPSEHTDTRESPNSVARRPRVLGAPVLVQFVKFGIVGVSNTLLTLVVYTVLLKVFGVWYLAASAIGFVVGAVNGFLLNRRWTFREHVGDALTPVRWGVVQTCGLGLDEGLLYLLVHDAHMGKLIAQVCATAVVTVSTFLVNRAWTFRVHASVAVADADV